MEERKTGRDGNIIRCNTGGGLSPKDVMAPAPEEKDIAIDVPKDLVDIEGARAMKAALEIQVTVRTIRVPEELSDYLESLQYDADGLQELLVRAAKNGVEAGEAHDQWLAEYKEIWKEYLVAKNELEATYVKPLLTKGQVCNWSLDFRTATVTVEIRENVERTGLVVLDGTPEPPASVTTCAGDAK